MLSFETTIWKHTEYEPSTLRCRRKICYQGECWDIEEPCEMRSTKVQEVIISFSYPKVDEGIQADILECTDMATYIASGIVIAAVDSCVEFDESCELIIQDAVISADIKSREVFFNCLWHFGVSEEIINECEIRVYFMEHYI